MNGTIMLDTYNATSAVCTWSGTATKATTSYLFREVKDTQGTDLTSPSAGLVVDSK